jgi:putative transcriptional regulator
LLSLFSRIDIDTKKNQSELLPVFLGGPIQPDRGFVLHEPVGSWNSSLKISEQLALTSSRDILEATAEGHGPKKFLVSLGYSGWGPGQLDSELISNSWLTIPILNNDLIFDIPAEEKVAAAFRLLGFDPSNLSGVVGHA